ncbi:MAG: alpha-L-fucosidase [Chloroflexi bacterium]|nr:alpha-L-fucosidase [Chloroflexota bacterium]
MYTPAPTPGNTEWFVHDRFGMFIHWGLYALAARHEWVKHREEISDENYQKYFDHFNPDLYDPKAWARAAREGGMKYFVVTTKHHEGFCLWDSHFTDYKATKTPYGKDLLTPLVEAFRAEGLKIGFYYSLIDWHHPQFPIDGIHPMRNHPEALEWNKTRDVKQYAAYMRDQVRELLTGFGKVDIIWFDFSYPGNTHRGMPGKGHEDWQSEELLKMVRELQPEIIVDNRLDLPAENADIHTPEQFQPREWVKVDGKPVVWEACQTFSGSWGYYRDEMTWKDPEQLVQMLINSVATGGNLLMNVGPTSRGTFDQRALDALEVYGEWMRLHSRSIYGCTQRAFPAPQDCRFTQNGSRLYLHIYAWPFEALHLEGFAGRIAYAQLLNDGSEIRFRESTTEDGGKSGDLTLQLPVRRPDVVVPVIELFLKE